MTGCEVFGVPNEASISGDARSWLPARAVPAKQSTRRAGCPFASPPPTPNSSLPIMSPRPCLLVAVIALALSPLAFAEVSVKEADGKVRVEIDGQLFTEYNFTG